MSRHKEKRLKKLKKQRIWPHILGIFFLILFTTFVIGIIACAYCVNLFEKIVGNETENVYQVIDLVEEKWNNGNSENEEDLNEACEYIEKVIPNIEGICILESDKVVYQYGEDSPDLEYEIKYGEEELLNAINSMGIMLTDDEDSFITVSKVNWKNLNVDELFQVNENYTFGENRPPFTYVKVWYSVESADNSYNMCIKTRLTVESYEIEGVGLALFGVGLLAAFIILYHLLSIINLVFKKKRLAKIVYTDVITGGYNLQYFFMTGNKILKKQLFKKNNGAVVTLRMDKYRNFCSCYGTKEGEELLEIFHNTIKKCLDKKELVVHAEKGDFAMLLAYSDDEALIKRLKDIILSLEQLRATQKIYFSVGIYRVKDRREDVSQMYNLSGVAMNNISDDSEERIRWFTDEMYEQQLWIRKVEDDMESALDNKEFKVYLQPKYSTKEEKLSGAEALVRWIHPIEGFIPPFKFIPIFESNGFILKLDDYMIREVARQQAEWLSQGKEIVPISVNVSRIHFTREDLARHICRIIDEYNVPHNKIELELTESAFFDDKQILLNTVKELREYGFAVSMDDFGAGYSSLNSLKELPLDVVKLDAEFFRDTDENGRGDIIVGDTIALAKKLDMKIVAEGIETREQVDFLATKECDLIQGYYFAKPMPLDEFEKLAFKNAE